MNKLAKLILKAAGVKGRTGAHAYRIGGATDLADEGACMSLLQAKGRWASDIGRIYAQMTRRAQLATSRAMQRRGDGSRDMAGTVSGVHSGPLVERLVSAPKYSRKCSQALPASYKVW